MILLILGQNSRSGLLELSMEKKLVGGSFSLQSVNLWIWCVKGMLLVLDKQASMLTNPKPPYS